MLEFFFFVMKAYNKVPIPLKNKTVAGSIFKRIGTKTDDPNIANKCWTLKGIAFFLEVTCPLLL